MRQLISRRCSFVGASGAALRRTIAAMALLGFLSSGAWTPLPVPAAEDPRDPGPGVVPEKEEKLLVTHVTGMITSGSVDALVRETRRWLVEQPGITTIVLELDTPGGEVEAANRLAHFIYSDLKHITTIAFVPPGRYAYSAGSLIAIAAGEIVMGTDSHMGAATPGTIQGSGFKELGEKFQSAVRNMFKTYAVDRGYPTILTDAMVSKNHDDILKVTFTNPDEVRFFLRGDYENVAPELRLRRVGEPAVILRRGQILTMNEKDAMAYGFIRHTADNLTELRNALVLPVGDENVIDSTMGPLKSSFPAGQALIDFFNKPFPRLLLLLGGCLGVLIELKTFGLAIPSAVAAFCFAIFFLTSMLPVSGSLEGTASVVELVLFLIGGGLVALEFLLLPGMAVFAISGAAICTVSLVLAMVPPSSGGLESQMTVQDAIGTLILGFGVGALCFFILMRFLPHNPLFARKGLVTQTSIVGVPTADNAGTADDAARQLVGATGKALTPLRPAGKVETDDGRILDVVAQGEFLERDTKVRVSECSDGKVLVVPQEGL